MSLTLELPKGISRMLSQSKAVPQLAEVDSQGEYCRPKSKSKGPSKATSTYLKTETDRELSIQRITILQSLKVLSKTPSSWKAISLS